MATNDLQLLADVIGTLRAAGLDLWLFGGWAEDLRGVRAPGRHADIDLVLRSSTFDDLEAFLRERPDPVEIPEKRFSHKRAFTWEGVRVEVFLVRPTKTYTTVAFNPLANPAFAATAGDRWCLRSAGVPLQGPGRKSRRVAVWLACEHPPRQNAYPLDGRSRHPIWLPTSCFAAVTARPRSRACE